MTKYLSLVQQNINDITQLKKENEYRSVLTGYIGLVNKSLFCKIYECRSYNFVDVKVMWQHPLDDILDVFLNSV